VQSKDCRSELYLQDFSKELPLERSVIPMARRLVDIIGGSLRLESFFGPTLRTAIDEVIDMPRTGRYCVGQLEKTEKTYIGTKVEIVLRSELGLAKGKKLDTQLDGREMDIKNTTGKDWMIPREAVNEVCLLVLTSDEKGIFSVGLMECRKEHLRGSSNQDGKTNISAAGKKNILWLVQGGAMPENVFLNMTEETRQRIFSAGGGTRKLAELFRIKQGVVIQRSLVESLAQQKDYMKRVRRNGGAQDILDAEDLEILWGGRKEDRQLAEKAGYPHLTKDEFICLSKGCLG